TIKRAPLGEKTRLLKRPPSVTKRFFISGVAPERSKRRGHCPAASTLSCTASAVTLWGRSSSSDSRPKPGSVHRISRDDESETMRPSSVPHKRPPSYEHSTSISGLPSCTMPCGSSDGIANERTEPPQ